MGTQHARLLCCGRLVSGPLDLLSHSENGLTYGLGYVLSRSGRLLKELLAILGVGASGGPRQWEILLQERTPEGITDLELHSPQAHVVVEAKKAGWPDRKQLQGYARKLSAHAGCRVLCALGAPPVSASRVRNWQPSGGILLKHLRWVDILTMVLEAQKNDDDALLGEYAQLIQEVVGMRAYDREVLVRDVAWGSDSYHLFFKHHLYICQASEIAEPLFFAPCFSGPVDRVHKGIHYFSRVYHRSAFRLDNVGTVKRGLGEAADTIQKKVDLLKSRKTTAEEVKYLEALPGLWKDGARRARARTASKGEHAIFFLGAPLRLPKPLQKKGYMIPLGFSMSLEQLMKGGEARFEC